MVSVFVKLVNLSISASWLVLAVLALVVLAVPPVTQLLGRVKLGFPVPQTQTGYDHVNAGSDCYAPISIFTHASVFLLASAAAGFVYYRRRGWIGSGGLAQILKQTTQRTRPSAHPTTMKRLKRVMAVTRCL